MTPLFMILFALSARTAAPAPPPSPPAPWKAFAECSAAYYADAQIPDLQRTRLLKDGLKEAGRRYSARALSLREAEAGRGLDRSKAYTKSYILERTRLLALRARPEVRAIIDGCPKL